MHTIEMEELTRSVRDFVARIDDLYAHYLDTTNGFAAFISLMKPDREVSTTDDTAFYFGEGSSHDATKRLMQKTTVGDLKKRNRKGGKNHQVAGQMFLVLLYTFWDEEYRPRISASLGLGKRDELKAPLLDDIGRLRHDVIHHHGFITNDTAENLQLLEGFAEGSVIDLTSRQIEDIVRGTKAAMDDIVKGAGGIDPKHRTLWRAR
jgi:hypothetical protein